MQYFFSLLSDYFRNLDKWALVLVSIFVGILVFANYRYAWENKIWNSSNPFERFFRFYFLYLFAFAGAYFLQNLVRSNNPKQFYLFLAVMLIAPAIFALKVTFNSHRDLFDKLFQFPKNKYYLTLLDYPIRGLIVLIAVWLVWKSIQPAYPFCGLSLKNFQLRPYLILMALMIPLIALASLRPDFLGTYPKYKVLNFLADPKWYDKLLFEISYGLDFVTIEIFFRGFLVLAFAHFVGKDAILPMAAFYCVIHFGKPLPECISSYFGGMILGVLTFETQTIIGGLIVHLGIAWMMEAGGYLGRLFRR